MTASCEVGHSSLTVGFSSLMKCFCCYSWRVLFSMASQKTAVFFFETKVVMNFYKQNMFASKHGKF